MAEAIGTVAVVVFFILLFCSDNIAEIISARKSKELEIEKQRTEQKRLDLEIAKVQSADKTQV